MNENTPMPEDLTLDEYELLLYFSMLSKEQKKEALDNIRKLTNRDSQENDR